MKAFIVRLQALTTRLQHIPWVRFFLEVFARFGRDNGGLLAAGLAFFLILAFVPLMLVGLWFLGQVYAGQPDEALYQIQTKILPQVFPSDGASQEVTRFLGQAHISTADGRHAGPALIKLLGGHGWAGLFGFLTTVWAAVQIFINGSAAMNAAWETQEKRNWIVLRLTALGLLVGTGILLIFSLAATAVSTHISSSQLAQDVPFKGLLFSGLAEVVAVVISAVMYAAVYKYLPSALVTWKAALAGGVFSAIGWEIAKKALAVYLLKPNSSLYGDLGNLIVFILWILYSMTILLLGAEVAAVYAEQVEQAPVGRLKRAALVTPAAESPAASGSPMARVKERDRRQRLRKNAQKEGQQAGRR